jgi:hypothetical protein
MLIAMRIHFFSETTMSQNMNRSPPSDAFIQQAHQLVDDVIDSAMKQLEQEALNRTKTLDTISYASRESTTIEFEDYDVPNIEWLSIDAFNVEKAEDKINEFIQVGFIFLRGCFGEMVRAPIADNY